ncbi:MAG: hypothetical protein RL732_1212 [Bacteroidota bacterium]
MQIDQTTLHDLSIFHPEEEYSLFHLLDFTNTVEGRERLRHYFSHPYTKISQVIEMQQVIRAIAGKLDQWPAAITNGTIMVIEKFYDSNLDPIPSKAHLFNALDYRLLHSADFALTRYSLSHFADFLRGIDQLLNLFTDQALPAKLMALLRRTRELIDQPDLRQLIQRKPNRPFSLRETVRYGYLVKDHFKKRFTELIELYGHFDAVYSMARALQHFNLCLPEMSEANEPYIEAHQLYHLLLRTPVPYDFMMGPNSNFIFLTGANMAGKSTFIKSVGAAVYLAHLGMGVPAASMKLTLFDGVLSNINVMDNIAKGESYFFNEVQRIKNTILKVSDGSKWLVLIDELFKGTNVQDAMKCSLAVIKGLIRIPRALFILSTHLYEIGEELRPYPNITFRYFETTVKDDQLSFSYQLREGISNDRLGYLILKREKVIDILEKL